MGTPEPAKLPCTIRLAWSSFNQKDLGCDRPWNRTKCGWSNGDLFGMWRPLIRIAVTAFQRARTAVWFVTRPRALGVHAIVLTPAGKIVLVRHTYAPGWRLPGGGVKREEGPEAAIVRELREELGLSTHGSVHHVCNFEHRPEHRRGLAALFRVENAVYAASPSLEIDEVGMFEPQELPSETSALTEMLIEVALDPTFPLSGVEGSRLKAGRLVRLLPADLGAFSR